MKKTLLSVALLMVATCGFAQDKLVKQAQALIEKSAPTDPKKSNQFNEELLNEANVVITPALDNELTKDKATAWNEKAKIHYYLFNNVLNKIIAKEEYDSNVFADQLYATVDAWEKCNQYDIQPDKKGNVAPKYKTLNSANALRCRSYFANAGSLFSGSQDWNKAYEAFARYLEFPKLSLVEGLEMLNGNLTDEEIAYYACLSAYNAKDYKNVLTYWNLASGYEKDKFTVYQLKTYSLKESGDTIGWLQASKEASYVFPDHDSFAQDVVSYYSQKGQNDEALAYTQEYAQKMPGKLAYFLEGCVYFNKEQFVQAGEQFEKAINEDPEYAEAVFNAANSYYNAANEIGLKLPTNMKSAAYKTGEAKYKELAAKALPFYEKLKELRPDKPELWENKIANIKKNLNIK
jgi:tetratricopeptide (TPR) repeat protein